MTSETRTTIEPEDIRAIELECAKCGFRSICKVGSWFQQLIACPNCNSETRFGIGVSAFAYLQDDGCESTQDIEWDDQSSIVCCACEHSGIVKEFTIQ